MVAKAAIYYIEKNKSSRLYLYSWNKFCVPLRYI
jgi:hypothetical protein